MHPDLLVELDQHAPRSKVIYCLDLEEALACVIDEYQTDFGEVDQSVLVTRSLRVSELTRAALNELSESQRELDPVECGLPMRMRTAHGLLDEVMDVQPASVTNLEGVIDLPFTARFTGSIRMIGYSRADGSATIGLTDDDSILTKVLVVTGTATCDPAGHIISGVVIDSILGEEDDPDVLRNRKTAAKIRASVEAMSRMVSEQLATLDVPTIKFSELFLQTLGSRSAAASLSADFGPALQSAAKVIEQIQAAGLSPGLLASMRSATSANKSVGKYLKAAGLTAGEQLADDQDPEPGGEDDLGEE